MEILTDDIYSPKMAKMLLEDLSPSVLASHCIYVPRKDETIMQAYIDSDTEGFSSDKKAWDMACLIGVEAPALTFTLKHFLKFMTTKEGIQFVFDTPNSDTGIANKLITRKMKCLLSDEVLDSWCIYTKCEHSYAEGIGGCETIARAYISNNHTGFPYASAAYKAAKDAAIRPYTKRGAKEGLGTFFTREAMTIRELLGKTGDAPDKFEILEVGK